MDEETLGDMARHAKSITKIYECNDPDLEAALNYIYGACLGTMHRKGQPSLRLDQAVTLMKPILDCVEQGLCQVAADDLVGMLNEKRKLLRMIKPNTLGGMGVKSET